MAQIGAELIADEVDIIIPVATPAAVVMQTVTEESEIPIVFSAVSDPVDAGLLADMDAPGGSYHGTSDAIDTRHIFELMLAAEPEIAKVGFLYDKGQASSIGAIKEAKEYCRAKGIAYVEKTGTNTSEISAAADALVAESVDAVFTPQDNTVMTAELAIFEKFVEAGIPHYTGADSLRAQRCILRQRRKLYRAWDTNGGHGGTDFGKWQRTRPNAGTDARERNCHGQYRDSKSSWH